MRIALLLAGLVALVVVATPATAQGKGKAQGRPAAAGEKPGKGPKHYKIKKDRAIVVTREVLVKRGFKVDRVDDSNGVVTVWYYPANVVVVQGQARPPLQNLVIHQVQDEVFFEQAPPAIMLDIDVRLKF